MVTFDGRHQRCSTEVIGDQDGLECASKPLRMRYAFHVYVKPFLPARAIKLSKTANNSTATVRREATFTGTMQSLLSYAKALEENCGVSFVVVPLMDIVRDMVSSKFSAVNSGATYILNIRVCKVAIEHQAVLLLFKKLPRDTTVGMTLGITHLDYLSLYLCSEEHIILVIQTADAFVENDYKPALFYSNLFY